MKDKRPPPEILHAARRLRAWVLSDMARAIASDPSQGYHYTNPAQLVDELSQFLDVFAPPGKAV